MAHLKNLVVNGNSRTIGTVYAGNYVGKVNGYTVNISTKNSVDTRFLFLLMMVQYNIE